MAVIRYILERSADDNPSRWNPAELRGPLLSDLLHRYRTPHVPVENEQVLRLKKKTHHVHGALTDWNLGLPGNYVNPQLQQELNNL
jgi:hypothetical protein